MNRRTTDIQTINVEDLPQPVAHALETVVRTLREELHVTAEQRTRVKLPVRPGQVLGHLTRDEIYGDIG